MDSANENCEEINRYVLSEEQLVALGYNDPVIQAYKKDIDRTLLRENLKLTAEERLLKLRNFMSFLQELRGARRAAPPPG